MSSYIQNYGFTKTLIQDNKNNLDNEIQWQANYDGKIANIDLNVNNNGNREFVSMQLNNNDLNQLFGIQPVEVSLEKRLMNDFLSPKPKPITLEGALIKRKSRKNRKKHHKRRRTRRSY
jgi:hypothetical protein